MDLSKFAGSAKPIAFLVTNAGEYEQRPGYYKIEGLLEDGTETFIVATNEEWKPLPSQDTPAGTVVNVSGFANVIRNKIGKLYLKRVVPLPDLKKGAAFNNPFVKKA